MHYLFLRFVKGLELTHWHSLREQFDTSGMDFMIEPYTRYVDQPGEQATMFIKDSCGNHLEFKTFKDSRKSSIQSGVGHDEVGQPKPFLLQQWTLSPPQSNSLTTSISLALRSSLEIPNGTPCLN